MKEESYRIVGICMAVHRELGMGFQEIIYKDALEIEFIAQKIPFKRELRYEIFYKGRLLPHSYSADFVVYDSIILEVKATSLIVGSFVKQTINYLKASHLQLGIIANFGCRSFESKRIVF